MLSITRKLGNLRSRVNEDHAQWLKGGKLEKTNVYTDMFKLIKVQPFFLAFMSNQIHSEGESFYYKSAQARSFLKASW